MGKEETDAAHYRIGDRVFERGNFAFIYEKTENRELFLEFLNAEKNAEINYQDSLAGFRRGIEGLSYYLGLLQKNGKKPTSEDIPKIRAPKTKKHQTVQEPYQAVCKGGSRRNQLLYIPGNSLCCKARIRK